MPLVADYLNARQVRTKGGVRVSPAALVYEKFTDVPTAVTNGLATSHIGQAAASTVFMTLNGSLVTGGQGNLSPRRNVVITVTHASAVVAMSGTITGLISRRVVTEAWSVTAGSTSKTFTGAVAFDTILSITEVVAADASANTIIAGTGVKLGTAAKVSVASLVKETADGSVVTNGTLVAGSTSANADSRGTYAPNTAPDGSHDYEVWYISNQPEQSPAS